MSHCKVFLEFLANTMKHRKIQYNFHRIKISPLFNSKKDAVASKSVKLYKQPFLFLWVVPFLTSSSELEDGKPKLSLVSQQKDIKKAIRVADELFESNKYEEATSVLLPFKESGSVEVLWRLCRAQYNWSQQSTVTEADKRQLIFDAYTAVSEAMEADDAHWAVHKWMSVLLDARSAYDGIKARVSQLERVKFHMLTAVELNPKDATTYYMLGSWCYQIADMPWFQRKIAATIFAAPPTSSFEEALHFFNKAEEVQPKFYSQNLLMLGKTLLKLQRSNEAMQYLLEAKFYEGSTEEDNEVRKEAAEILKTLKINNN